MMFALEAIVLCVLFTAIVVSSLRKDPLAWIEDYPPAIVQRAIDLKLVPQETAGRTRRMIRSKAPKYLLIAIVFAAVVLFFNRAQTFLDGFLTSYALWFLVAWYDALVLDCLWFCHSKAVIIPGTEDLTKAYHDYGFHLKMSCIGSLLGLPECALVGLLVWLFHWFF